MSSDQRIKEFSSLNYLLSYKFADQPAESAIPKGEKPQHPSRDTGDDAALALRIRIVKTYCGRVGKVKIKTQVYTCIKKLQKAIAEKKIRKTSEYASQIVYIRNRLIAFYNDMKSGTKTYEIPAAKLAELKEACNMRRADHVVIIRQYINILNDIKTGLTGKAQKLLKKIEASEFSGNDKVTIANITKNCLFFFCDSANSMQMDLPRFEQVTKLYPYLSWVLMFRTTKDGNFLGEKNWKHAVNVEV